MNTIVIASQWTPGLNEQLAAHLPDVRIVQLPPGTPADVPPEAQALLSTVHKVGGAPQMYDAPPGWPFQLRWIQLISSGTDFYPQWLLDGARQGIAITTARGTAALPMSEFALAALFDHAKALQSLWVTSASAWRLTPLPVLHGSTLGLVGLGAIGEMLARKALALGLKVLAVRRSSTASPVEGVEMVASISTLFERSDHVVLLAPGTPETRHLVNAEVLSCAKPGLHLINLARGSLVDQTALLAALDEGRLARATLDVTEPEPLPDGHPLYGHPKVRIAPHTSAISPAMAAALVAKVARNLARLRAGEPMEDAL